MSKIDEMIATFEAEYDTPVPCRAGLRAVLEKHVKAMVAKAYEHALHDAHERSMGGRKLNATDQYAYAERVISELEGTRPDREGR